MSTVCKLSIRISWHVVHIAGGYNRLTFRLAFSHDVLAFVVFSEWMCVGDLGLNAGKWQGGVMVAVIAGATSDCDDDGNERNVCE